MDNRKELFKIGCFPTAGFFITGLIILIRALSKNSAPIEQWSAKSWFFMFLPVIIPAIVTCFVFIVFLLLVILSKIKN